MSMQEYAEAAEHDHADKRDRDDKGRIIVAQLTDREISVETLTLLRGLSDGMSEVMAQIGPTMAAMQSGPLGRILGGNGRG